MEIASYIFQILVCIVIIIDFIQAKTKKWVFYHLYVGKWMENDQVHSVCSYYVYQHINDKRLMLKKATGKFYDQHPMYEEVMNMIANNNLKIIFER